MKYEVFLDRPGQDWSMIVEAPSKEKALETANNSHGGNETTIDCVRKPLPVPLQKPQVYTIDYVNWKEASEYIFKKYRYNKKQRNEIINDKLFSFSEGTDIQMSNGYTEAYLGNTLKFRNLILNEFARYYPDSYHTVAITLRF